MSSAAMNRPLVLITGASAGIGAALARIYAENQYDLLLIARREERLAALATELEAQYNITAHTIASDLSKPHAIDEIITFLDAQNRHVDVLINNAGFGLAPEFTNTQWAEQANYLRLMLEAPCELTHKLLPAMRKRGKGSIINMASMAGYAPGGRGHTLYAATKAALIKFSQSLHQENKKYGLNIVAVCPGLTYSEFHDVNGQREKLANFPKYMWQTSEQVAKATFRAGQRQNPVYVPGLFNQTLYILNKLLPETLSMRLLSVRHSQL
ncbi:SDR family NAD(P)-dependent oxidoreductase [Hirschia litorea]|uniref:SDR family NAD(P)-dependent oxidoreductase n=1 Tax=Hirschia litorea TaxID=1199156 RepID=A0ABW2INK6_9PROT